MHRPPRSLLFPSCFYSGTETHPVYVDHLAAQANCGRELPVVMLHGAFHTGVAYLATPDGRPGWASFFSQRGHDVYVPDWPGHGRSPARVPLAQVSTREAAASLAVLIAAVGPAIVLAHSAAGPMAWWIAENHPESVAAVIGIAPGPPANLQQPLPADPEAVGALRFDSQAGCPVYSSLERAREVGCAFIQDFWANSPRFPKDSIGAYSKSIVPESSRILNERFNIGGAGLRLKSPALVADRPILIVTGDCDPRHPQAVDQRLATFLGADFLWLPDAGVIGNGHMLMIEENSDEIATLISRWMQRRHLSSTKA
ncbi:Pimeloyl-ACP methyl ester carboxylesterase [Variovorax sp. HW608]|uniref:alpha/beta fold hydrolase n=1 Tax=Variovorax sp. HW608 TaxID=1034889 RepID=UPI00081FC032|nr:alpha/beta fold hydrolase [Variovorax sp. HW608]SCK35246.1 Pimeloyl-ACP methyl ester carboxylesterase [Variovorax sp. HW608]